MSSSIYVSLTGLLSFSNGLNNISSNITNMNTNGYKKNDLLFQDLVYQYKDSSSNLSGDSFSLGSGVQSDSSSINFAQGDIRKTGNDTDVAIDGKGFFILKDDKNNVFYSRNGSFEFASNGDLVLKSTDLRVQALGSGGSLNPINISNSYSDPAKPTSEISLSGNLSTTASTYTLNDMTVYDSLGESHKFSVSMTRNLSLIRTWDITVNDENGNVVATGGQVQFQGNGSPEVNQNLYTFLYTPTNLPQQSITLNFGDPGSFSGTTNFAGTSQLAIKNQDGYAAGGLTNTVFNSDGLLELKYSNGKTYNNEKLALANFINQTILKSVGNSLYVSQDTAAVLIGYAKNNGIGELKSQSIELSNVDLTEQFTDMVVIQRGYQASSQMLTATNEMIQKLIEATK